MFIMCIAMRLRFYLCKIGMLHPTCDFKSSKDMKEPNNTLYLARLCFKTNLAPTGPSPGAQCLLALLKCETAKILIMLRINR